MSIQDHDIVYSFTTAVSEGNFIKACSNFKQIVRRGIKAKFELQGVQPQQKKEVRQIKTKKEQAHPISRNAERAILLIKEDVDRYFENNKQPQKEMSYATPQPPAAQPQKPQNQISKKEEENLNGYRIRRFPMPDNKEPMELLFLDESNFKSGANYEKVNELLKKLYN